MMILFLDKGVSLFNLFIFAWIYLFLNNNKTIEKTN
jgi:hypothetical protein